MAIDKRIHIGRNDINKDAERQKSERQRERESDHSEKREIEGIRENKVEE